MKNRWWGYEHMNGSLQVKIYFGEIDIIEAGESPFVKTVRGPWECDTRQEALAKLQESLNITSEAKSE